MSNEQKTPFARTQNRFAERKIDDSLQIVGKFLPASVVSIAGSIVTVKFEVSSSFTLPLVTMPLAGSEYVRLPIQPGCKGMVISADARLGAMSGLANGIADLSQPANLSALVFVPLGNKDWFSVDGDELVMYGLTGLKLMDSETGSATVELTSGKISMAAGGHTLVIDSSGVVIDGRIFLAHEHTGVQTGGGVTGGVV